MIKIDVISGFLGAGKTTLIKKLFEGAFKKEKVALVENEFGEIGIDSSFLKDYGINIKEINSGCICCSLVGNFEDALKELISTYTPERIIIEPSGVGKLSEIIGAINSINADLKLNVICTVVDGGKYKMYSKNFGEFYIDQIREANTIVLSKTDKLTEDKIISACEFIKEFNPTATIITTPVTELDGALLLENLEDNVSLVDMLMNDVIKNHAGEHHHHHEHCDCEEHEHHHEHCDCEEHEHEHHHEHCHCEEHEHEHHHEHCHCEEHHHEGCCCHHHNADEVFESVGTETPLAYTKPALEKILSELAGGSYGVILRSKGVVKAQDCNKWYYFDFVAGEYEIRLGEPDIIGKLCVIGSALNKDGILKLLNERG